jgi:hypothetical protein
MVSAIFEAKFSKLRLNAFDVLDDIAVSEHVAVSNASYGVGDVRNQTATKGLRNVVAKERVLGGVFISLTFRRKGLAASVLVPPAWLDPDPRLWDVDNSRIAYRRACYSAVERHQRRPQIRLYLLSLGSFVEPTGNARREFFADSQASFQRPIGFVGSL